MKPRYPYVTLLWVSACLLIYAFGATDTVLRYDRVAVSGGEYWRLFTGHLVHFSPSHLLANTAAFSAAGWVIERRGYPAFALLLVVSAFCIGAALLMWQPHMRYYGGLSGMVHAALFYLALWEATGQGPWRNAARILALGLVTKAMVELFSGVGLLTRFGTEAFVLVPLSHAIGLAAALLVFLLVCGWFRLNGKRLSVQGSDAPDRKVVSGVSGR
jgi:rhomboid family GlyGly-CTERM serine protease